MTTSSGDSDGRTGAATSTDAASPASGAEPPPPRILLVEDHSSSRAALRLLLTNQGYAVTAVGSAREAELAAARERFELLVSDIGLPDGDGYGLLARLRQRRRFPAIAVSAHDPDDSRAPAPRGDFEAYRVKPIDFRDFIRLVRSVLEHYSRGRGLVTPG